MAVAPATNMRVLIRGPALSQQMSSLHFSTDHYGEREKVAAWREAYGRAVMALDFEPMEKDGFNAEARMRALPGLAIASVSSTASAFSRPRNLIKSDDLVFVTVESGCFSCTHLGREIYLGPGDSVFGWSAETVQGKFAGRTSVLCIPTKAIAPMVGDVAAGVQRRLSNGDDMTQLLRSYAAVLAKHAPSPALERVAPAHVYDLVAAIFAASRDMPEMAQEPGVRAARLQAIKTDVARNLEFGDLSVGAIARRHRVSQRTLHKLFEGGGTTFGEYVLAQRLAHAHRLLSDPRRAGEKVATIAFAAGFGDVSYFHRAFRRRYGATPSEVRERLH
jgi:AraC-like DNA-binding protein